MSSFFSEVARVEGIAVNDLVLVQLYIIEKIEQKTCGHVIF